MILTIFVTVGFFGILGTMGYFVYKQIQKTDPKRVDTSIINDITSAQEFLPFKNIKDGVIDMGGHDYRAILECSSTNYNLKTDNEKDIIEASFQRFINSLTFPITIFIQTKVLDSSKLLTQMEKELINAIELYPQMEEYANVYFNEMSNLSQYTHNNKQKKKFIIVPYNEAINLEKLSEEEKYEYSVKEVRQRAIVLSEGLSSIGIKAHLLDTRELAELVYSTYHRDNYANYENIVNGEHLSLVINNEEDKMSDMTDEMRMDWILYEAQMRIRKEITEKQIPNRVKLSYEQTIKQLESLRDSYQYNNDKEATNE